MTEARKTPGLFCWQTLCYCMTDKIFRVDLKKTSAAICRDATLPVAEYLLRTIRESEDSKGVRPLVQKLGSWVSELLTTIGECHDERYPLVVAALQVRGRLVEAENEIKELQKQWTQQFSAKTSCS